MTTTRRLLNPSLPSITFKVFLALLPLVTLVGFHKAAFASGFALTEESVPNLGQATAGGAALAEDASTLFFNPAGLTRLDTHSIIGAGYIVSPNVRFRNNGSTAITGTPLLGGNGGDAGSPEFIPNFYAAWSASDAIKVGIGVYAPFGLTTDYDSNWVGRYQATRSQLTTININPTVAARLSPEFSVGAGLNVQFARAELGNAIDFGLIGRSVGLPTLPQRQDGSVEVAGEDWSVGFNAGVLYEPSARTRVGLAYRSPISHRLRGTADFTVPTAAQALTARGQFTDSDASADLNLPDTLSLSAYHELSDRWAVMGDVTWTGWSRFEELRVEFDNPAQPDSVQRENWQDTVRVGVGVRYQATDNLTLRAGVALDPSPVRNSESRTPRVPDSDRTWVAVGASYQASDSIRVDLSYAHLFVEDAPIDRVGASGDRLVGDFDSSVDIVGVQVNWEF